MLCSDWHVVASDQPYAPTLAPPAPSFQSIAQRSGTSMQSLRNFLRSTHQSLEKPKGMPDPMLADFQIRQIGTYLLSLKKCAASLVSSPQRPSLRSGVSCPEGADEAD